MTGIDVIVAAVAAGGTAGLTGTASAAITDAYTGLRSLLVRRLTGPAAETLDVQAIESAAGRARLGAELARTGADRDEEILAIARTLLTLVESGSPATGKFRVDAAQARGVQVGDHNTQTNTFS